MEFSSLTALTRSLPGKWAPLNISDYQLEPLEACTLGVENEMGVENEIDVDGGIPKGKKKHSQNKE